MGTAYAPTYAVDSSERGLITQRGAWTVKMICPAEPAALVRHYVETVILMSRAIRLYLTAHPVLCPAECIQTGQSRNHSSRWESTSPC